MVSFVDELALEERQSAQSNTEAGLRDSSKGGVAKLGFANAPPKLSGLAGSSPGKTIHRGIAHLADDPMEMGIAVV